MSHTNVILSKISLSFIWTANSEINYAALLGHKLAGRLEKNVSAIPPSVFELQQFITE